MDLILWRHAEAHEAGAGEDDLDRALTHKGERHAARVAEWLQRHLAESTRVIVSPAKRCQQTAQALGRSFKTVAAIAPDAPPEAVLKAAKWPEASNPVLVVGHQPTLGQVAALLLTGEAQPWTMKKGGVWWLRQRERDGEGQVVVQVVQGPDSL